MKCENGVSSLQEAFSQNLCFDVSTFFLALNIYNPLKPFNTSWYQPDSSFLFVFMTTRVEKQFPSSKTQTLSN